MKNILLILFLNSIILSQLSYADSNWLFSVDGQAGYFSINDPDAGTEDTNTIIPRVTVGYKISRTWSVSGIYDFIDVSFDAEPGIIGQEGEGSAFGLLGAYQYPLFDNTPLEIRAGLKVISLDFTNRLTLDGDGFIDEEFNDRSLSETVFVINGDVKKQIGETFYVGVGLFLDVSDSTSFYGFRLTAGK